MTKRRLVVGLWVVAVLIGAVLVLEPWRWWGGGKAPESTVAQYIKSVDGTEQQMQRPLTQLLTAYKDFSVQNTDSKAQAKLAKPARTLRTLERRLSALKAPPQAKKLQSLLAQFVSNEHAIAAEIQQLAAFMPRFQFLTEVASVAKSQLARALAAAAPPKPHAVRGTPKQIAAAQKAFATAARKAQAAQADAIDAYDKVLAVTIGKLRPLQPPPVIAPAYRSEVQTLAATRKVGASLSAELRKPDSSNVPVLSRRFTEASRISGSVSAQRAEIAAVEVYNARVKGIRTLESRIRVELNHLQHISA